MIFSYLKLIRPANIITAISNVVAGYVIAVCSLKTKPDSSLLKYLVISTIGLYGGGITFNDFFDADIDALERPYRPIPSGNVKKSYAGLLGIVLFVVGIISALKVSFAGFLIACIICICCFFYNTKTKYYPWLSGFTLALCRGLNMLLGTTFVSSSVEQFYPIAFVPFWLTIAITYISKKEIEHNSKKSFFSVTLLYFITLITFGIIVKLYESSLDNSILFLSIFTAVNLFYLIKALLNPIAKNIQFIVKWGVLSFVLIDAAIAASFSNLLIGLIMLLFMPLCIILSKLYAIT